MAAHLCGGAAPLSLRHGVRCEVSPDVSVEEVLLAVGEQVGCENIVSASRMNRAVVVFVRDSDLLTQLIENGITVSECFYPVVPLVSMTTRVIISNVPLFIPNSVIERELTRFGKLAREISTVPLNCKNKQLKHVTSFRRRVIMFLKEPTLEISFRVTHEGKSFMLYASSTKMRCFQCGEEGHQKFTCPQKQTSQEETEPDHPVDGDQNTNQPEADGGTNLPAGKQKKKDSKSPKQNNTEAPEDSTPPDPSIKISNDNKELNLQKTDLDKNNVNKNAENVEPHIKQSKVKNMEQNVGENNKNDDNDVQMDEESETSEKNNSLKRDSLTALPEDEFDMQDEKDEDSFSDISELSQSGGDQQLYTLQEINQFLDDTYGKPVEINSFFPDTKKFLETIAKIRKNSTYDELTQQKRYRLKKLVTKLRKGKTPLKKKKL